ncbi:hypothetical protein G4Y73_00070 [Wenzhouxiangella sp. XN201]|uniref:hypothetical protein n=1 Tax=Wenzhouxiangella sp. XN201 TaxID=2710755 RepID=UPI0013C6194D|nr:hypothetical protein [Wenzhouxiangella sp. XN201]NEZ02538.1 hypothetical protein [Wenzhouxiangella sp. XN201]
MFATVLLATLTIGPLSFLLFGGINGLASDVGMSGAWFLTLFFHLLYGALSVVGLTFALLAIKAARKPFPSVPCIATIGSIIAITPNLLSAFRPWGPFDFYLFILLFIAFSSILYLAGSMIGRRLSSNDAL